MDFKGIEFHNIKKDFSGKPALSGIDLRIQRGTVHSVVGENGAGKSTLMNILNGVFPPSGGYVTLDGEKLALTSPLDALRYGWEQGRFVAAICAGPTVLADLGITDGRNATCYPGCEAQMGSAKLQPGAAAVRDGRLITGTSAGCAVPFALELIRALRGEEKAQTIAAQIVIR